MEDNLATNKEVNKENGTDSNNNLVSKPKKELPIEKKPFQEFINLHLIPALVKEINQRGLGIVLTGESLSFFSSNLETGLLFELVLLSLLTSLFGSKFSSIKKYC